jgi:hypothetical protein
MPIKRKPKRKIIRNPSQRNAKAILTQIRELNDRLAYFIESEHIVEFAGNDPTLFNEYREVSKKLILKLKLINDRLIDSFD